MALDFQQTAYAVVEKKSSILAFVSFVNGVRICIEVRVNQIHSLRNRIYQGYLSAPPPFMIPLPPTPASS